MPLTYFRPRGDIKSNWELANPILKLREMGIEWETTVGVGKAKIKFGDGVTAWNNLNYAVNVASQIQSDTKSNWTSNNPVLGKDEMGIEWETTVGVGEFNIKVGDGTTAWNDLAYGLTSDITNKAIKTITEYSGDDENPALADGDTLSVAAGKLNEQQTFLKNTLGYERLATMAETLGGLSNEDFMGVMEKLNSIKFNKTDVYNGTDSTSTSLAASANALKTVKDLTDTNTTAISQLNSDMGGMKFFTNITSLGLEGDTATPNSVIDAMPYRSALVVTSSVFTNPAWNFPDGRYTLEIISVTGGRAIISLYGKTSTEAEYRMFLNGENNYPSGEWTKIVSNANFIYQTFEQASIAVPANGDITVEFNISKPGYKALGIVGFASSNPTAIVSRAQMVPSENKVNVTLKNTASSQTNTLTRIQVLYLSA